MKPVVTGLQTYCLTLRETHSTPFKIPVKTEKKGCSYHLYTYEKYLSIRLAGSIQYLSKCFVQLLSYRQKRLYVVSKLYVTSFKATLKIKRTTCWITSKIRTLVHSDIMLLKSNPLSSISLWNMFNRMDQEFSRTKSRIEG